MVQGRVEIEGRPFSLNHPNLIEGIKFKAKLVALTSGFSKSKNLESSEDWLVSFIDSVIRNLEPQKVVDILKEAWNLFVVESADKSYEEFGEEIKGNYFIAWELFKESLFFEYAGSVEKIKKKYFKTEKTTKDSTDKVA